MSNGFWSAVSKKREVVFATIALLVDEYGFAIESVMKLQSFWSDVRKPGRFEAIRADLATRKSPYAVTLRVRSLNKNTFGGRATKCKFEKK